MRDTKQASPQDVVHKQWEWIETRTDSLDERLERLEKVVSEEALVSIARKELLEIIIKL